MKSPLNALPIVKMTLNDDFQAYEAFVASVMKPEDYYPAATLKTHIASGYVSAWWVKTPENQIIGWCGLNHYNKKRANTWNFLGVAVHPSYRNGPLALRLIRHIFREGGTDRDASVYIQPGVETEKLLKPFGFQPEGQKGPWLMYVRKAQQQG